MTIAAASRPGLPTLRAFPAPRPLSDRPRLYVPTAPAITYVEEWPDGRLGVVTAGRAAPLDQFETMDDLGDWLEAQVDGIAS